MSVQIISVNGTNVEVVQEGSGRDLVLLPTLLAELSVYDEVIAEFAKQRRVHRINFPGFGGSTGPIGSKIEDYADLIAGVMKQLDLPKDTDVLGNGFGGFVAGTLAIHHGAMFDKLVLVDTGPGFPEEALGALKGLANKVTTEGMASVLDIAISRMFPESYHAGHQDVIARRKEKLSAADPVLFANAALSLTSLNNYDRLGDINNETLVVVGLDDQTTPPVLSRHLHDGIKGSQLVELPGIGHCPQLQDPKAFMDAVKPFLGL